MIKTQYFEPDKVKNGLHFGYLVTKYDTGKTVRTYCSYEKISCMIPALLIVDSK
jgi:hypothetical protein